MMRDTSSHLRMELDVSLVPLGLKGAHDSRVEWLVATVNRGVEAQLALEKPRTGNGKRNKAMKPTQELNPFLPTTNLPHIR